MTVYRRRMLSFTLALSLLITLIPAGIGRISANAESEQLGMTLKERVIMRYGPSTGAKIMFYLPENHVCVIKEEKDAEKIHWYKVETNDPERQNGNLYTGYIHGDFFRPLTDEETAAYYAGNTIATPTPIPDNSDGSPTPTPTPAQNKNQDLPAKAGSMGSVTAGGTNFREGPGTGYRSITRLDRNTQVELLTIPSQRAAGSGTFYKVRYNNIVGYIMCDFISIISGGPEDGSESATPTPTPQQSNDATPTPTPAQNVTPTPTQNNASYGGFTHVKLILSSCHLRVSPGGDYDRDNDWEGQGSILPLAGDAVKQGGYTWYPVSRNGRTYYVRNDCVQPFNQGGSGDVTPTPAPTSADTTPTPTPTANPNGIGYVKTIVGGCNLRATIGGTVIKQIAKNVTLPYLLEPVEKNGYKWYFVQAGENRGYLRGDVVKVVSGPVNTPTPTPVPTGSGDVTPTPTPEDPLEEPTGYVKTTAAGVNLRKKAGFSDIIGQVARNVILPYYGEPTVVKGVSWYFVKHPTLGDGFLHGNYVMRCNSDGSAVVTPTPEPGTITPVPTNSGKQEASYTTLKIGSTGQAVKNLITELKNQGYYSGEIGTRYTTAVAEAVKAFQRANGLTVDGIAGAATQHKLFGTVPIGAGDSSNLDMTLYPAEKIDWYTGGINELWARGSNYKVYDVKTGIVWWAHRWAGGLHVDAEPLTAADTARLCKSYGVTTSQQIKDQNLYQRRPLLVTIGTRTFACSLYGVPHNYPDGDTISTNDFKGQVCIHFTNSKTHESQKVDSGHEEAIQYAWEHAPNGHK